MNGLPFAAACSLAPLVCAAVWYRAARVPLGVRRFLLSLLLGAAALALSAAVQYIIFLYIPVDNILFAAFVRAALVEEGGRFCVFAALFAVTGRPRLRNTPPGERLAAASGIVAALSFACLENAWYALDAPPRVTLLRVVAAAPLHAACGARGARAALILGERPRAALALFASAAGIHGFYNYFAAARGALFALAPVLALLAFASQAVYISQKDGPHALP